MIISVFGGSFGAEKEDVELAYELGKRIALKGHVLKNGGYNGTMEAAAKACREHGGEVIGVCVEGDPWVKPNKYSTKILHLPFEERVRELVYNNDAIIVLPGQVGTLYELLRAWIMAIIEKRPPVYFLGDRCVRLYETLAKDRWVREDQGKYIKAVRSLDEIDFLR